MVNDQESRRLPLAEAKGPHLCPQFILTILITRSVILYKWNDNEKLQWLRVRLTGKAHVVLNQLSHKIQPKNSDVKKVLYGY